MPKFANIRAEVEIVIEWPDDNAVQDDAITETLFKMFLRQEITRGGWVNVTNPKVISIREEKNDA